MNNTPLAEVLFMSHTCKTILHIQVKAVGMQQQVTTVAKMLSRRALANIQPNDIKNIMAKGSSNAYDAHTNPSGMISLGVAENRLM
jgi:hypothetical protein